MKHTLGPAKWKEKIRSKRTMTVIKEEQNSQGTYTHVRLCARYSARRKERERRKTTEIEFKKNKYSSHLLNKLQTYKINLRDKKQQQSNASYKSHKRNPRTTPNLRTHTITERRGKNTDITSLTSNFSFMNENHSSLLAELISTND